MSGCPVASPSPSNDVIEILRKLQSVGYFLDLSISEPDPQKLGSVFNRILTLFHTKIRRKREIRPVPVMLGDGKIVDLFKLYSAVRERGGYESVTARTAWTAVSEAVGFDGGRGPALKLVYVKYLGALERWLELVLAKNEVPGTAAAGELRAEVSRIFQEALEPKKEEDGRQTPVAGSKKNHFLTPVRDGGRRPKLHDDEKGNEKDKDDDKDSGGDCDDDEVVILEPPPSKGSCSAVGYKRKRDALVGMLDWVLRVAKNPGDAVIGKILPSSDGGKEKGSFAVGELYSQVLSARRMMFRKKIQRTEGDVPGLQKGQRSSSLIYEDHVDGGILPSEKLRYSHRLHSVNKQSNSGSGLEASMTPESDKNKDTTGEEANTGKKKIKNSNSLSELNDIMTRLLPKDRKYEAAKKFNTAEVPQWTNKSYSTPYSSEDLKWLGRPVWDADNEEQCGFEQDTIGKGRQDSCRCQRPGSVECTRFHVAERRVQLRRELGSAFYSWRFDCMGEEVALSWTEEEAQKFKSVVHLNPPSEGDNFWNRLRQSFPAKGMKNLVSYYFNVFLLARRSYQNRVTPNNIDSDDEETDFDFLSIPFGNDAVKVPAPRSNLCAQNTQCVDIDD